MTDIEVVNPVSSDDVRPWFASMATTFLDDTEGETFERLVEAWRRDWPAERIWGARVHGRWVASLATQDRTITVPGPGGTTRDVTVDALTAVAVNATHRRRGLLTRMLTDSLQVARERNAPFSILIAAEWPIYGRFGYAPASRYATYRYYPRRSPLAGAESGSIRQVDPADLDGIAAQVFDRARVRRAGQIDRRGEWWPRRLGLDGYRPIKRGKTPNYYVHESDGRPDGLLWWSAERDFELNGDLGAVTVGDLTAATDTAYRNLWAFLSGIDAVGEVVLDHRPIDEPIRWLLADGRALRQTYTGDDVWVRLLDIPAALAARSYSTSDRLVIDVVDADTGGYAAGRYLLEAADGESSCRRTEQSADLRVSQRTLASTYLGAFSLRQLAITGAFDELTPGAIDRADAMFATTLAPWNATMF